MDRVRAKLDWFKTCLLPHEAALRARLRRIMASHHELDDMVAEIMARAYACEHWERITAGRSYLYAIARNLVIDNARRNKVVSFETIADLELLQAGQNVEAQIHARDALRKIQSIVDTLPPQCRRAFILRRVHEKSMAEIAEEMQLSVSTVEKHLAKSVALVMRSWAEREETDYERAAAFGPIQAADRGRSRSAACPAQS